MKCSSKCRTKKLGMIYAILEGFCSFLNWEGADTQPHFRPRKIRGMWVNVVYLDLCTVI